MQRNSIYDQIKCTSCNIMNNTPAPNPQVQRYKTMYILKQKNNCCCIISDLLRSWFGNPRSLYATQTAQRRVGDATAPPVPSVWWGLRVEGGDVVPWGDRGGGEGAEPEQRKGGREGRCGHPLGQENSGGWGVGLIGGLVLSYGVKSGGGRKTTVRGGTGGAREGESR